MGKNSGGGEVKCSPGIDGDDDYCAPLDSISRLKRLSIFLEPRQYFSAMC